jgi:YHS domain-containing protein
MKKFLFVVTAAFAAASCNNQKPVETKTGSTDSSLNIAKAKYTINMVDNKIDLSCGMPLTAGIEDTCHYNGRVYGFCSKECKDEFLKNPAAAIKEK